MLERRIAAGVLGAAVLLGGCGETQFNQINSTNIVDCGGGLKENSQPENLPSGSKIDFGTVHNSDGTTITPFTLESRGNGFFRIEDIKEPRADISPDGTVIYNSSDNIHYVIKMSEGPDGTTHFDIKLSCIPTN